MLIQVDYKSMKRGKNLYVFEEMFTYFISIAIGGAYFAKIASSIGISQGLTGILTSFISLCSFFQVFALFFVNVKRPKKLIVTIYAVANTLFACLYLIPSMPIPSIIKHATFISFLFIGNLLYNLATAPKTSWEMSFVSESERGVFTGKKEAISLISGIVFSYLISFVIDYYESINRLEIAFIISAIAIFFITLGNFLTLILMPDREMPTISSYKNSFANTLKTMVKNRPVLKVFIVAVLYNIINCSVMGFFGTYATAMQSDYGLGYTMSFIALVSMIACLLRALISKTCGIIADKYSFKVLLMICHGLYAISLASASFMSPSSSKIFYVLTYVFYALALAGTNSGRINLLYEEVALEQRMSMFAVQNAISGVMGFISAIGAGFFVDYVRSLGGKLNGLFAQQWLAIFGVLLNVVIVLFIFFFMKKKKTN